VVAIRVGGVARAAAVGGFMKESRRGRIFRPGAEAEVAEEFAFHFEMKVRELMASGMDEASARAEAARRRGELRGAQAECVRLGRQRERRLRVAQYASDLGVDVRYALRGMRRSPGFTAVVLLTIALGVGANAGIFSVLNGVLLRPLPYAEPERLVQVATQFPAQGFERFWLSPPEYFELKEQAVSLASVGAYRTGTASVGGDDAPVRVTGAIGTPELFRTLGVAPLLGRTFTPEESLPGAEQVVLLSHGLWQRAFGGDPGIAGRLITVNARQQRVVGVMPPGFDIADAGVQIWSPAIMDPAERGNRGSHYLDVVARLAPGVTLAQARAELDGLVRRADALHPETHTWHPERHPLVVVPLADEVVGGARQALVLLLGAVGFVLLIACANVANLLLARAEARQREIAVRAALGGGRARLLRQFVTEGMVLSLIGGALGLLLGWAGVRALLAANPGGVPRAAEITLDGNVLLFTLGVALLTGVLFGLAPAFRLAASGAAGVLRDAAGRATAAGARLRSRRLLVTTEFALAVVLLVGCMLMLRSFAALRAVDPGFEADGLVTFELFLPPAVYPDPAAQNAFYDRLLARLEALPRASGAAAMSGLPPLRNVDASDIDFEGIPETPDGPVHAIDYFQFATHDYPAVMRIPIVDGRGFEPADAGGAPVALINERAARVFFPHVSPVGRRARPCCDDDYPWFTIVGVLADVKQGGLEQEAGTEIYFLHPQAVNLGAGPRTMNVVVRAAGESNSVIAAAREIVRELDAALPVANLRRMDDVLHATIAGPRFVTLLLSIFAGVALALAAIGTYGVMAYAVAQRRQEIGIRMALGAEGASVLGMVLRQGLAVAGVGLVLGVAGALALSRLLSSMLFDVAATDPAAFIAAPLLLGLVALLACWIPARRAASVDPATVLKQD
jgi:putative ABC transport system permease protein